MEQSTRLRLLFGDSHILSKSQKIEGLKRSWIILNPQHQTISDLSSYVIDIFHLHRACPAGLILSMDGFILPPFESICILKDNDIVHVKKRRGTPSDIIKFDDGETSDVERIVDKQPWITGAELLANEKFEKETGGYESETEEEEGKPLQDSLLVESTPREVATSKKRKASSKRQSSKQKKYKSTATTPGAHTLCLQDVETNAHKEQFGGCQNEEIPKKSATGKKKSHARMGQVDQLSNADSGDRSDHSNDVSTPDSNGLQQLEVNSKGSVDTSQNPCEIKKFPSRSARRKKAKRKWMREQAKIQGELRQWKKSDKKEVSKEADDQPPFQKDNHTITPDQQPQQDSDEEEVVPIVIRPGHIRFESLGKDEVACRNQHPVEADFQWNGITSKKKGQKWGKEKPTYGGNDYNDSYERPVTMVTNGEEVSANHPIDFDKLVPYADLPQEGDVIAYRLIELSSSWCPEISSYRVGKVSWYDLKSRRVELVPVPEHPIIFSKNVDEECSQQPDISLYKGDGLLEIDFPSLIDVRVVKRGETAEAATSGVNESATKDQCVAWDNNVAHNNNNEHAHLISGNGGVNGWDEICKALNAKKAQLSDCKDASGKKESSGRSQWSYRALRGSALGPTISLLRSQNEL